MLDLIAFVIGLIWDLFWAALYLAIAAIVLSVYAHVIHGGWPSMVHTYMCKLTKDRRPPDLILKDGRGGEYMRRWWLIPRNKFLNIYIHNFRGDDPAVPHDHPWWSMSYLMKGMIYEYDLNDELEVITEGSWVVRSADFAHRLALPVEDGIKQDAWTIFITGPSIREWGFHCKNGWVSWPEAAKNRELGDAHPGCGEKG